MTRATQVAKRLVRSAAHAVGLEVSRFRPEVRQSALQDIRELLWDISTPVVFDVGANIGQSVTLFRDLLPRSIVHSFEPGPVAFAQLEANTQGLKNLRLVNAAVGSVSGTQLLLENEYSDMSSLLPPASAAWGSIVGETQVAITTLDDYCRSFDVPRIDLLKIDTQGYELEVLRGATGLLAAGRIGLVYLEVTFVDMYEGLPPFDVLFRFLVDHQLRLVALYNYSNFSGATEPRFAPAWCDALFVRA
jgi:FkbM family methyltransferase